MTETQLNDLAEALRKHAPSFRGVVSVKGVGTNLYADGTPGMYAVLKWDDGYSEKMQLSVNLRQYGMVAPQASYCHIRDYSEYTGVATALEAAGIVTKVEQVPIGYGTGWLVKINMDAVETEVLS